MERVWFVGDDRDQEKRRETMRSCLNQRRWMSDVRVKDSLVDAGL